MTVPPVGEYRLDPARSRITIAGTHLFGMSTVTGTFALTGGRIVVAEPVTDSLAEAEIDAASFASGSRTRDDEIRSRRFLHSRDHPLITFTGGRVYEEAQRWLLAGTLTVRDTARKVVSAIENTHIEDGLFTARATTVIDRTAFGLTYGQRMGGGREFDLTLEITAVLSRT
ncbi:YceI family protein [Amycolatopsis sp. H20-H5]|uniref:YceI family protein n=1 Tax=Amycolatopsis sp. H20-H5 TaxID=3046309 RepID=UPI002DB5CE82|nr:YceI family protein [Amycolatopsis sp. H20-H5]MEC3975673.1 YceI family protein [Amycolatopsis sp. H20-H5]